MAMVSALCCSRRREKTGNAEHVVEIGMRQQQPIQSPEPGPASEQLTLGAFAAIHQNPVAAGLDEKAWMVAVRRRNACRRAEKGHSEHRTRILTVPGFKIS
jgi:hypothetical protein